MKLGEKFPEKAAKMASNHGRKFAAECAPGEEIEGIFLVRESQLRTARSGAPYIGATLADKTGTLEAKKWDSSEEEFARFRAGMYVKVRGRVEEWQGTKQIKIDKFREAAEGEINPEDFMPVSSRPIEAMEEELLGAVKNVGNEDIRRALDAVFGDERLRKAFLRSPAAKELHHAWIGGLAEHTLSVVATAEAVCRQQKTLRRDILIAGALLHDIGKTEEISPSAGFPYTDAGGLLGHILLGALIVDRSLSKLKDFPEPVRLHLLHMIASHHGTLEFGAVKMPATAEAIALHHIECLDAKIQGRRSAIEKEPEGSEGGWTDFLRIANSKIFKG